MHYSTSVINATCQVSLKLVHRFVKIFEGFYHIRAWPPSWSCDLDYNYIIILVNYTHRFPHPIDASYKISALIGPRSLKMLMDGRRLDYHPISSRGL